MFIPTVEVYVVSLAVIVVRIGEVVIATAAVPEEAPLGAPVLAGTPAPEVMLVEFDGRVALSALEQ